MFNEFFGFITLQGTWIEVDPRLGAGVLAWEFFNKGDPVPLLLRAIEDSYLGRNVFKDGKAPGAPGKWQFFVLFW